MWRYRFRKSLPLDPFLGQLHAVQTHTPLFFNTHFNIVLQLCVGLTSDPFPLGYETKFVYAFCIVTMRATYST